MYGACVGQTRAAPFFLRQRCNMAQTAQEIQDAVSTAATKPQSVQTDAGSFTNQSLFNQIEYLKFMRTQEAQAAGRNMPKFQRLKTGNSTVI